MSLLSRFFYRRPPDGLLELSERVYVFDSCFSTEVLPDGMYQIYLREVVMDLYEQFPCSSFLAFNFREGEKQSKFARLLNQYDVTVIDYPRQYENCPILPLSLIQHLLRISESWLADQNNHNVVIFHCERAGWPLLAFIISSFLVYRKLHSVEGRILDAVHREAPKGLLQLLSPLNPYASQLRYLQYVAKRNITPEWPPPERALSLDCVIIRSIPSFDSENGCRPIFRIYGRNLHSKTGLTTHMLYSTHRKKKPLLKHYRQVDCDVIKIDIQCLVQGDVVLECLHLETDSEREVMMFRVLFNTAFIRSNILMLNSEDLDILWEAKDRYPKGFRAEILFGENECMSPTKAATAVLNGDEKGGLPIEAFSRVQDLFSGIDWSDSNGDASWILKQLSALNDAKDMSRIHIRESSFTSPIDSEDESNAASVTNSSDEALENHSKTCKNLNSRIDENIDFSEDNNLHNHDSPIDGVLPASSPVTVQSKSFATGQKPLTMEKAGIDATPLSDAPLPPQAPSVPSDAPSSPPSPCCINSPISSLSNSLLTQPPHGIYVPPKAPPLLSFSYSSPMISNLHLPYISVLPRVPPPFPPLPIGVSVALPPGVLTLKNPPLSIPGVSVAQVPPPPPLPSGFYSAKSLPSPVVSVAKAPPPPPPPLPPAKAPPSLPLPPCVFGIKSPLPPPLPPGAEALSSAPQISGVSSPKAPSSPSQTPSVSAAKNPPPPPPPLPPSVSGTKALSPPPQTTGVSAVKGPLPSPPPPPPPPLPPPPPGVSAAKVPPLPPFPPGISVIKLTTSPAPGVSTIETPPPPPPASTAKTTPLSPPLPSVCSARVPPPPPLPGVSAARVPPPPPPFPVVSAGRVPPPPPPFPVVSATRVPPPPPPFPVVSATRVPPPPPPFPVVSATRLPRPPPPPPLPGGSDPKMPAPSLLPGVSAPKVPPPPPIGRPTLKAPTPPIGRFAPKAPPPPPFIQGTTTASKLPAAPLGPPPPPPIVKIPNIPLQSPTSAGRGKYFSGPAGISKSRSAIGASNSPKKTTLKPLHWVKVTRATQGSLWADSQKLENQSRAPVIDITELESLFAAVSVSDNNKSGSKSGSKINKPEKIQLIDLRRAYNCEIMLSKIKIPLCDMISAVLALDSSALDIDQVENLIKFCPTKEEMETLKNYTGEKEMLGRCEQFFMELMKVPRVEAKLRVFAFRITFSTQVDDLRRNLGIINDATKEVKESSKLRQIMQTILTLGNALNQGTARGSAVGFKLDSLLKLSDTRARNNKMTLMHYLCKLLSEKMPELLDFYKDLVHLDAAFKIQLKTLAEEMQAVSKGLEKVEEELIGSEADGIVSVGFRKVLKTFLHSAEADVRALTSLYSEVGRNADSLSQYFGEDPARCPFEQVTQILSLFVKMFKKSKEENERQAEAEKKRLEKEERATVANTTKDSHFLQELGNNPS